MGINKANFYATPGNGIVLEGKDRFLTSYEEKAKDKKAIIIKSKNKNEKYPLKELTQLKNYQNYRILNADKKGKKKNEFSSKQ